MICDECGHKCFCRNCLFTKTCWHIESINESKKCMAPSGICKSYRDHFSLMTEGVPNSNKEKMENHKIDDIQKLIKEGV